MGEWAPHDKREEIAERLRAVIDAAYQVDLESEDAAANTKGMKREDGQWIVY